MHALFHGTTSSRAAQIVRDGWRKMSLEAEVDAVAAACGVEADAIWANLRARYRFVDGATRGECVSFATSLLMGDSWAQRAPEIRHEALFAAWRLLHPQLADDANAQIDGSVWVLRHMLDDAPAVLRVELTDEQLLSCREGGFFSSELADLEDLALVWDGLPEIEVPFTVAAELTPEVVAVPRRVSGAVALHLLGLHPDEWVRRAKANEFGVPHRDRYGHLTWAWDDLVTAVVPEQWERRVPVWE